MVFIYRFHCTSTTTVHPLGGLYIQVPLYINYYSVSLGWSLYTGSSVHQLIQCVPWVVFMYRFHCTSPATVRPLGGLYMQVPLYINYYSVSLRWLGGLYNKFHCISTAMVCPLGGLCIQVPLYINYVYTLQCVLWVVFVYRLHALSIHELYTISSTYVISWKDTRQSMVDGGWNKCLQETNSS